MPVNEGKRIQHPDERRLAAFMRGESLPREEARAIVRHLLTGCRKCIVITLRFWRLGNRAPGLEALLEEILDEEEDTVRTSLQRTGSNGGMLR